MSTHDAQSYDSIVVGAGSAGCTMHSAAPGHVQTGGCVGAVADRSPDIVEYQ